MKLCYNNRCVNGVTRAHWRGEMQVLPEVNSAGARQLSCNGCRDDAGAQNTVGDATFENGRLGKFFVDVHGIVVTGDCRKKYHIGFRDGFREGGGHAHEDGEDGAD